MTTATNQPRPLALVTGGMRRLGAAIAARLASEGYDLALNSHGDGHAEAGLEQAIEASGAKWHHCIADLSNPDNAAMLMADVCAQFGRAPDLLVNNAAIFGQDGWHDMDTASLEAHFRLNVFSPLLLAQALVKATGEAARPCIVNIVDQRVVNPNGDQLSYTLSKQALGASVRSMAAALGSKARVNGVAPGLVIATGDYDDAQLARLARDMPLGTLPDANGVANAVAYLANARHVTGQILFVDGGANLKSFPRDFMHL